MSTSPIVLAGGSVSLGTHLGSGAHPRPLDAAAQFASGQERLARRAALVAVVGVLCVLGAGQMLPRLNPGLAAESHRAQASPSQNGSLSAPPSDTAIPGTTAPATLPATASPPPSDTPVPATATPVATATPTATPRATAQPSPSKKPVPSPTPVASQRIYVVQVNDTLWSIAQKFKTTTAKLEQANGLTESSVIYPGQKLIIP